MKSCTVEYLCKKLHPFASQLSELEENPPTGSLTTRIAKVSAVLGRKPDHRWTTSFPSGGGSEYASWYLHDESVKVILEKGGFDMITGREFSVIPEIFIKKYPEKGETY